jgi:hypothetical protein
MKLLERQLRAPPIVLNLVVEKTLRKFRAFEEAEREPTKISTRGLVPRNVSQFSSNSSPMPLNNDSKEFIALLNSHGVEYLIVGAHSLAFHARPRFTGDLGILVRPTPENAAKIVAILNRFGFSNLGVSASDFTTPEQLIQLGRAPNRIDLLTSLTGVNTEDAFATKVPADLDQLPVFVLSKTLLIANKRAVGRPQDLADLTELE